MIKGFVAPQSAEPLGNGHVQWMPALCAGLIAGVILLIVPRASPWEGLGSFSPAILGRIVPGGWDIPMLGVIMLHLCVSLFYGLVVSFSVLRIRELRAVFAGGIIGLLLYLLNFGIVSLCLPAMRGSEVSVIFTHIVFGLIAAATYRGLLRRHILA